MPAKICKSCDRKINETHVLIGNKCFTCYQPCNFVCINCNQSMKKDVSYKGKSCPPCKNQLQQKRRNKTFASVVDIILDEVENVNDNSVFSVSTIALNTSEAKILDEVEHETNHNSAALDASTIVLIDEAEIINLKDDQANEGSIISSQWRNNNVIIQLLKRRLSKTEESELDFVLSGTVKRKHFIFRYESAKPTSDILRCMKYLSSGNKLNDDTINCYMGLIEQWDKQKCTAEDRKPNFFFRIKIFTGSSKCLWLNSVETIGVNMLVIPLRLNANSLALVIVHLKDNRIDFINPLGENEDVIMLFISFVKLKVCQFKNDEWKVTESKIHLHNQLDCGVYACVYAYCTIMNTRVPEEFTHRDLPSLRKKMAYELLKGKLLLNAQPAATQCSLSTIMSQEEYDN